MPTTPHDGAQHDDPIAWFLASFAQARQRESFDASRAALATTGLDGGAAVRFVLVKIVDARGFTFFTNYESVKARELEATPRAALAFHWASTGEQFRVRGAVQRIPVEESDAYFATRPRESQLGAWASQQSAPIADRAALDAQLDAVTQRFAGHAQIPRPAHWGGYRIAPSVIEVWRDRSGRLHDRWSFARANDGAWSCQRLQP